MGVAKKMPSGGRFDIVVASRCLGTAFVWPKMAITENSYRAVIMHLHDTTRDKRRGRAIGHASCIAAMRTSANLSKRGPRVRLKDYAGIFDQMPIPFLASISCLFGV